VLAVAFAAASVALGAGLRSNRRLAHGTVVEMGPAGAVATTRHRGPYAGLGETHETVRNWAADHGRRLAGPRWEIYGPHRDDPAEQWVEVGYLMA